MWLLVAALIGYLLGALPFGFLVARAKGVNIFEVGSKNPGATNVRRVLGSGPGNLVFALDAAKGALSAGWPLMFARLGKIDTPELASQMAIVGLIGALVGHSFSCFTHFKGGKGVATGSGGLLVLLPFTVLIGASVWIVTFYASRYVSLASILASLALPVAAYFLHESKVLIGLTVVIALFVIIRHRSNVGRLMAGTENKIARKSAAPKS